MKRLLGSAASALATLAMLPAAALAASVTFTDNEGPGLHQCISAAAPAACLGGAPSIGSTTLYLNILDDGFVANGPITSAKLTLTLDDDGGAGDGSEKLDLKLDGVTVQNNANVNHNVVIEFTNFDALADGLLTVQLIGRSGDFFLEGAALEVVDDPPTGTQEGTVGTNDSPTGPAAVPAPAAIVIVGAGLLGLGWKRRIGR